MTAEDKLSGSDQRERDLDAELRFDLEQRVAEKVRAGMGESQARRAVRLEFGGIEQVKEECRDARGARLFDSLRRDVMYALRLFARAPGFTAVAVAILAVGIGINAAVFTLTNTVLFGGFPLVKDNDRLLYITNNGNCCISYPDFDDLRAQSRSFEDMALTHGTGVTLTDQNGFAEAYPETLITSNTFRLIGQQPVIGRDFTSADEVPGAAPVAILRYGLWVSRFAKDPGIVGRTVRLNGVLTTIIGVMPEGFSFPQNQDIWALGRQHDDTRRRGNYDTWFAFGRLRNGVSPDEARVEIETIGRSLQTAYPDTNKHTRFVVQNFQQFFIHSNATTIYRTMWAAVGFVLLIACANLANMLLSRAVSRSREISVRIALGAGRWRVIRQLLIESVILSGLGGIGGWWVAKTAMRIYTIALNGSGISVGIGGDWFDHVMQYRMDYRVFIYLIAISVSTGLLFGLAPASRLARVDVNDALKDQARGVSGSRSAKRWGAGLAIAELAMAVVLLAGAGVMIRSFLNVYRADLGFDAKNIGTTFYYLPGARYGRAETQLAFADRLTQAVQGLPEIESASIAVWLPGQDAPPLAYELDGALSVPGGNAAQSRPHVGVVEVGKAYFKTLGLSMETGREFDDRDGPGKFLVTAVNQKFAEQNWPGQNPVGKRIRLYHGDTPDTWLTVVGVAPNIAQSIQQELVPVLYLPYAQSPGFSLNLIVRSRVPMGRLENAIRSEVKTIDPDLANRHTETLTQTLAPLYRFRGVIAALFLVFAAIALLLAAVGLYAVMAEAASRRTQEIGIRMALGASGRDIQSLVFRQGMLPLLIGLIVGLIVSLAVNRVLRSQLVAVSPSDPATYAVAVAVLTLAAALGCWIPARRAMRVDPAEALRHE